MIVLLWIHFLGKIIVPDQNLVTVLAGTKDIVTMGKSRVQTLSMKVKKNTVSRDLEELLLQNGYGTIKGCTKKYSERTTQEIETLNVSELGKFLEETGLYFRKKQL